MHVHRPEQFQPRQQRPILAIGECPTQFYELHRRLLPAIADYPAQITDGASNTYLIGEKYLNPDNYATGLDSADNENLYVGWDNDHFRTTSPTVGPPIEDQPGYANLSLFGSAHANGFQMSLCDGSVHLISYAIEQEVHRRLGNRMDGLPIDAKTW